MNKKLFLIAGLATLALVGCRGGGGGAGGGTLATVNGDAIDRGEYYAYMGSKPRVIVQTDNGQAEVPVPASFSIAFQALRDMVQQKALLQLAKDEGVDPKPDDIKKELEFRKKREPDFFKTLRARGLTLEQINDQLAVALAEERLITKGITVSQKEVEDFIAANKENFRTPATIEMLWILAKTEASKNRIEAELKKGGLFKSVAQQYGEQPDARNSAGRYSINGNPRIPVRALHVRIQSQVDKLKVGESTDWIRTDDGAFAKFYVERKTPAQDVAMDDTLKEAVRRSIAMDRGRAGSNLSMRLAQAVSAAKVTIEDKALKEQWDAYTKAMKDQLAAQTNPTAAK